MLSWRHLTPGFVGGGVCRVKRLLVCFVAKDKPEVLFTHCGDTKGNHPNHFLLGF